MYSEKVVILLPLPSLTQKRLSKTPRSRTRGPVYTKSIVHACTYFYHTIAILASDWLMIFSHLRAPAPSPHMI
jgi:hypothetical protein